MTDLLLWTAVSISAVDIQTSTILEAAALVTDMAGEPVSGDLFSQVALHGTDKIRHGDSWGANRILDTMHSQSGLWDDIANPEIAVPQNDLAISLEEYVAPWSRTRLHLAGVHLSEMEILLARVSPMVLAMIDHQHLDLASLSMAFVGNGIVPYRFPNRAQRAKDVVLESVGEYRWLLSHVPTLGKYRP